MSMFLAAVCIENGVRRLQVGVVGSEQGMTDCKKVARHDFNPDTG